MPPLSELREPNAPAFHSGTLTPRRSGVCTLAYAVLTPTTTTWVLMIGKSLVGSRWLPWILPSLVTRQQFSDGLHGFDMFGYDLDDDRDRNAKQHAPDTPKPTPEQQRYKDGRGIHCGDATGHPGGDKGADEDGDPSPARDQQGHGKRIELHKRDHTGADGSEPRAQVRNDMQQACGDGPGSSAFQADPAEHQPGKERD